MIELRFRGWFQVRLATDPDPYDEPRGVSGYIHAYANEPDLDRIIRFQSPPFVRPYGPPVGVRIDQVRVNGQEVAGHPLLGGAVMLLEEAKFEGRNGVIAEDGLEPIFPFKLEIVQNEFRMCRGIVPANPDFPYEEFQAAGVEVDPAGIAAATGITSLADVWAERLQRLRGDLENAGEPGRTAIQERITFLEARTGIRFFGARMRYRYLLKTEPELKDPQGVLPEVPTQDAWYADFWLGGWDADALCGYCLGTLTIPGVGESVTHSTSLRRP